MTYIGDEIWQEEAYNYVIDPWTANKTFTGGGEPTTFPTAIYNHDAYYTEGESDYIQTSANGEDFALEGELYKNHFHEGMNTETFMEFEDVADIATTEGTFTPLLYTQENTMDVAQQKNGFTTGVIFEAEYKPEHISQYDETSGSISAETDYASGSFLVADFGRTGTASDPEEDGGSTITPSRVLSADMRTIAALGFSSEANVDVIKYIFNEPEEPIAREESGLTQENFAIAVNGMAGGPLIVAFQEYLQGELEKVTGDVSFEDIKDNLTWEKFVEASHTESNSFAYVPSDAELANGISGDQESAKTAIEVREELMENYNIAYYDGGKCYYKYWIQHNPLGDDTKMGVMEFAIVRNNVYQLEVSGIKDLGDPLPFTPGKDDPNNPDKETEVYIVVKLYVRNWVLRSNSDIIL